MAMRWKTELSMATNFQVVLKDERNPALRYCPICLLVYPRLLGGNAPVIPTLQTQYHGFFDTCIRNVSIPLNDRERVDLRRRLQHNMDHCVYLRAFPHKSHAATLREFDFAHVEDPVDIHRALLCQFLCSCLYGFDTTAASPRNIIDRAYIPQKRFRSAKGTWPIRLTQLFPYGEDQTVDAIVDCCCSLASDKTFKLLAAILDVARPRIWARLIESRNRRRLAWSISAIILLGIPGGDEQLPVAPVGCRLPSNSRAVVWIQNGAGFRVAAYLLDSIKGGIYAHPDDELLFARDDEELLIIAYGHAIRHYRPTEPEACQSLELSLRTLRTAGEVQHISTEDLVRLAERDPRSAGVARIIQSAMGWLECDRRCAGPQCARTMLDRVDEEDKPLSMCARCKLTRYCSKQCQQGDWTIGQPIPHKRLCPVLVQLQAATDSRGPEDRYLSAIQVIPEADLALAGRWALSRGQAMQNCLRACIASASTLSLDPSITP